MSDFRETVMRLLRENPDRRNPLSESREACVYDDGEGHRCIIGEAVFVLGWTPPTKNGSVYSVAPELGWPLTDEDREWATDVQQLADGFGGPPTRWGDVLMGIAP